MGRSSVRLGDEPQADQSHDDELDSQCGHDDAHEFADNLEGRRAQRPHDVFAGTEAGVVERHDRDDHTRQEDQRLEIIALGEQGNDGDEA